MNDAAGPTPNKEVAALPLAVARPARRLGWLWLLPLLALAGMVALVVQSVGQRGVPVRVSFKDGHGLKAGDAVRYRGIVIGSVEELTLIPDLSGVIAQLRLQRNAAEVARVGSRFWIVRPQVEFDRVSGLDTVIGANYVALIPGKGDYRTRFTGLEEPPQLALTGGGLEILLSAPGQGNLRPGTPISYRQVVIGKVLSVDLAKDAGSVVARAYIEPRYAPLVRRETRFWRLQAAHLSAGLTGLTLDVDSIRGLLLGGVTLATPAEGGPPAAQQSRFTLYDEARPDWLRWSPFLSLDGPLAPAARPRTLTATLRWQAPNYLYLYLAASDAQRVGRLLPVAGGLLGPADLLRAPDDAESGSVHLSVDGVAQALDNQVVQVTPELALLPASGDWPRWPSARIRTVDTPEDLMVVADPAEPARFVEARHIRIDEQRWAISDSVPFDPAWHGAAVLAAADEALVGLLLVDGERADQALIGRLTGPLPKVRPAPRLLVEPEGGSATD